MKLSERSYNSKIKRPKPITRVSENEDTLIVATAWGDVEPVAKLLDDVLTYITSLKSDIEVTSPFEFLECYPSAVNYVRTAIMMMNENLYRGYNTAEYRCGVEVSILHKDADILAWAHVGSPMVISKMKNQSPLVLSHHSDLSAELSGDALSLSPLPTQLVGVEPACDIRVGHLPLAHLDQMLLISSPHQANFSMLNKYSRMQLSEVTDALVASDSESAFWLGLVDL